MTDGGEAAVAPRSKRRRAIRIAVGVAIVAAVIAFLLASLDDLLVERLWFESLGQLPVWDLRTFSRLLLWIPLSLVVFGLLMASIAIAIRIARSSPVQASGTRVARQRQPAGPFGPQPTFDDVRHDVLGRIEAATSRIPARRARVYLTFAAALVALLIGFVFSAQWQTVLLWSHQASSIPGLAAAGPGATPTPQTLDPIFGQPLTFYLFDLPFYESLVDLVGWILDALLVLTVIAYLVPARRALAWPSGRAWAWHLGILVALRIAVGAIGFQLDKFALATSQQAYPYPAGVDATDAAVRIPGADLMSLLTLIAAIVVLAAMVARRWRWALGAFGAWVVLGLGLLGLATLNQALFVNPNPLDQQRPYIANDIAATRTAFGLDAWTTRSYPATTSLSAEAIVDEAETFANARLWDTRPLRTTLDQLQTVRQYYDFSDVDIDRYVIDGRERQVMLSAREMALDKNPAVANWLNSHFVYTHGYGLAMVPVSGVGSDGLPDLLIRDLPVTTQPGAPEVTEPRIYFGEHPAPWIITGARTAEFDYPVEKGADATTRWKAKTGIDVSGGINRLLISLWTRDIISVLTSPQITPDSQFVMHRTLGERLAALAPFLAFDKDPYLVVTPTGRLVWIVDAYTASGNYPMARALDASLRSSIGNIRTDQVNYLRDSVKVIVDAYDGTTKLCINDPSDPLIATWAAVYPTLFSPMPEELRPHLRYPEGLLNAQTAMYGAYHVTDATTFYQGDNLWTAPVGTQNQSQVLPSGAYYDQMRLPDEADTEFVLMQPMVPARRPNMIAWVSARNDGPDRGRVLVYQLPADTTVYGPVQVEALIDQTPEISSQVSLWNQSGSKVIRGELIVVPVGGSFVYLQPIYLQSTSSAFPQFTKIVVATPSKVVWANTLAEALQRAVGPGGAPSTPEDVGPASTPGPGATSQPGDLPTDLNGLIAYANLHFERAQEAMGSGKYETYGREMALVQAALERLGQLAGTPAGG